MGTAENLIRGGGDPVRPVEPPEYWRYTLHLASLAAAPDEADEAERVAAVLRDPDRVMAESAVVTHLDRRAARLLADERFQDWARAVGAALEGRAFPVARLREWSLLQSVNQGGPWSAAELAGASDWCQRTAVALLTSYEALRLLADAGRTRRVRHAAAQRLVRRPSL
ncbi:hypothetical protein OHU17_31025 [Streptomyces goshikiensis]|uniref:Uncharacterized protein n=1 Tax=Streptomyces goshikiensis TaxID=1942 RepID=A0ABZ1RSS7_9ACTN|nr:MULTISPECIES: hypothetical protein [Streptomyces]AKL64957.1 hypothetical protein M444_05645 [Streptomyces sp. Mg1]MBP0932899.1 hypothetical protein [Streptomyces sp. KCTC 0041BP]PJN14288.1 hypothetical protein CG724_35045 [Streptomyces sp. CB02120-2]WBY18892.1 hypothetical protein PET44_04210 [Streptomyces goshikiensis]WSR97587.1 hypothetical protein OG224_05675 [Streptomyces goshikiensis]